MDGEAEYVAQTKINTSVSKLEMFLNNKATSTPAGCRYTNFVNQKTRKSYYVPYTSFLRKNSDENDKYRYPIDEFFSYVEEIRISGVVMGFCERQYYSAPIKRVGVGS